MAVIFFSIIFCSSSAFQRAELDRRNDHLVVLQKRDFIFHYRGALYQHRRFIHFLALVHDAGTGFGIIAVAVMRRFAGIVLDGDFVAVVHQHTYRIGNKGNAVFVEKNLSWNADVNPCAFGLDVQRFF
jgi:hypothetical protein